jgi:hypothetical protein
LAETVIRVLSVPGGTVPGVTDDDTQVRARTFIRDLIRLTMTNPSDRDKQRLPGPSDLADPCDVCLSRKIALSCGMSDPFSRERSFSLKAWTGTAVHQKLEHDLPMVYKHVEQELTVEIEEIEGLGLIKGHVDLYVPAYRVMTDWKTTDLRRLKTYQTSGVPSSHFGQTMLYMLGLRRSGREVDTATLCYIPRDSNKESDIWVASCSFRADVAVGLLERARRLTAMVRSGEVASLVPEAGCFPCTVQPNLRY